MVLVIAGDRSGVGKTTVTLSLLAALRQEGSVVQSFKVGPDYIDPMFHSDVTGRACRNLDPVLTSERYVQQCFSTHSQSADYALVEGVMGLFDGAAGTPDFASTAHIARLLDAPILFVVDCSRLSQSIAAIIYGYRSFDPRLQFAGVVLNRVGSDRHLDLLTAAIAPLNIPVLGVLRRDDHIQIPDRHLGLVPTGELKELNALIDRFAHVGQTCFDWSLLKPLFRTSAATCAPPVAVCSSVRLAIARDAAFNFYYPDNLELLQHLGAELVPWSPMQDAELPAEIGGLYFGGGFPEVFAQELADNQTMRTSVKAAIAAGMPTYAECGGLMYLCDRVTDFGDRSFPMVGTLPTTAVMGKRLTLGYRRARALHNTPLLPQGAIVQGHEFHRSHLAIAPDHPLFEFSSPYSTAAASCPTSEGWHLPHLHASYLHLHWGATPKLPARFLQQCQRYAANQRP
ncbi:cobyrinate a,c-diamide synthase [Myxacorys almedinensis]|uniref:Cobyrinate a,c-diamide synthase n=1 Tax=Myxacorys almedinensis A TaxID=2690445 RepID=A0A8J7Z4N6_9CYAN|nr:cobyrinate a,c-diamide synthase [Myxacorys almedinensis]NDJ19285.1 cobyrinate a,c-diamide synthase [Myxacorys almedinensis A]